MGRRSRLIFPGLLFLSLTFAVACGGASSTPAPPPEATVAPTEAPQPAPAPAPPTAVAVDGLRILEDVKHLAEAPRPTATDRERQSADFAADRLRSLGYDVSFQEFSAGTEASRESLLAVKSPLTRTVPTLPLSRSGTGSAKGSLIAAGQGRPAEFPAGISGRIALIERGDLTFQEKVDNAQTAGASGVVIFNNVTGIFFGDLSQSARIPVVSISQSEGQSLLGNVKSGPVEVEVSVSAAGKATSRNVIATPPGHSCETVTGGHYDSLAQSPGANDNASGSATVLEVARILASNGHMGNNCFVLFGAEEIGLVGSRAYVDSLDAAARQRLKAMLNLDMVGFGDGEWLLIGSKSLQDRAQGLIAGVGIEAARGVVPNGAGSDHDSFLKAGIPALFLYHTAVNGTTDPAWHTPQDTADRLRIDLLEQAARLSIAMLESLGNGA